MKTRKVILNDNGKPMTPTQARREIREQLLKAILASYRDDQKRLDVNFDGTVDDDAKITLRDLLEVACR